MFIPAPMRVLACSLLLLCGPALARAAEPQLGSPDFKASPEHPLGWRGDGSGRYPGATPPTDWGRWAKTSIRETRSQAAKPKGEAVSGEMLPFGRLENWLIVGPIVVDDASTALEAELIPREADLRPDAGEKAGNLSWTAFKAGGDNQHGGAGQSGVEFYRALPPKPGMVAAYAHTYLYAPEAINASLRMGMPAAMKMWVNGQLVSTEAKAPWGGRKQVPIELAKGWNSILCKEIATLTDKPDGAKGWRFTATLEPVDNSFAYESRNIAWMTPLPAPSTALPVVLGDKVFVTSQYSDLLCINKADGKILWLRSNTYYDALTEEERAATPALKETVEPLAAKLKALNDEVVAAINQHITPAGLPTDQYKLLADKFSAKSKLEVEINKALIKLNLTKREPNIQHVGSANGTPVTDGTHVWAMFGGGIYSGPMTAVCYDLAGKRVWARGWSDVDAGEHGSHCSPLLVEGKLIVQSVNMTRALDAATGKNLWETKVTGFGGNGGGSPIAVRLGGEGGQTVIIGPRRDILRLSDGKLLHSPGAQQLGNSLQTPVLDHGIIYHLTGWGTSNYTGVKLPDAPADKLEPKVLYQVAVDPAAKYKSFEFVDSFVGSPLYDNGLVYYLTEGGVLHVSDAATGTPAYVRMMDEMRTRVQWVFWNGACGSPALAGKYIYLTDDNGITVVIEPGREYKKVAVNTLENYNDGFNQEQTLSTPVFDGQRMYYRTPGYLYCIGGK